MDMDKVYCMDIVQIWIRYIGMDTDKPMIGNNASPIASSLQILSLHFRKQTIPLLLILMKRVTIHESNNQRNYISLACYDRKLPKQSHSCYGIADSKLMHGTTDHT